MEFPVDFIVVAVTVAVAIVQWAWGVIWACLVAGFWIVVILLVGVFLLALWRPEALTPRERPGRPMPVPTIEAVRAALKSGALDAEIERINQRNATRREA